jgi:DNA-binding NtrC family response regulator
MPGHDGIWLARANPPAYPETAVIMATGVQDVAPAVQTLRQGAIDYLTKPFGRDSACRKRSRGDSNGIGRHGTRGGGGSRSSRRWRFDVRALNDAITALSCRQRRVARRDGLDADAGRPGGLRAWLSGRGALRKRGADASDMPDERSVR